MTSSAVCCEGQPTLSGSVRRCGGAILSAAAAPRRCSLQVCRSRTLQCTAGGSRSARAGCISLRASRSFSVWSRLGQHSPRHASCRLQLLLPGFSVSPCGRCLLVEARQPLQAHTTATAGQLYLYMYTLAKVRGCMCVWLSGVCFVLILAEFRVVWDCCATAAGHRSFSTVLFLQEISSCESHSCVPLIYQSP